MAVSPYPAAFAFDPPTGWNDSTVFPTYESSEVKVRSDLQKLHDQTRDYVNSMVTEMKRDVLKVSASLTSLPKTIYSTKITADHVATRMEASTPSAWVGEWTVTTGSGTLTIDGTLSGETDVVIVLEKPSASI